MELQAVLWGVLIPGLIAGIGTLLFSSKSASPSGSSRIGILTTASFAVGYVGLFGWPPIPSESRVLAATDWLVWSVFVAGVIQLFDKTLGRFAVVTRFAIGAGMLYLIMRATIEYQWKGMQVPGWMAVIALVGFVVWSSINGLAKRASRSSLLSFLLIAFTGLALCSGLTGSSKIAQMTGVFCAGLGAFLVVSRMRSLPRLSAGDATVLSSAAIGLGLCAIFYSELPILDGLLIAAGCVTPWLAELPLARSLKPKYRTGLQVVLSLSVVAIAVVRSIMGFETNPYGDYEY